MERNIEWTSLDEPLPERSRPMHFRTPSQWRTEHNKKHKFVMPSADDCRKIKTYIDNHVSDDEIKSVFNIAQKILDEIKGGLYNPYRDRRHGDIPKIGRLSVADVKEARVLISQGVPDEEIADIFGVCKKAIFNLRNKKSWTSIKVDDETKIQNKHK